MSNINREFGLPKRVYNMSANSSGDIVELLNPLVKDKYGDIFKKSSSDCMGGSTDVVNRLTPIGVHAYVMGGDKLYASKDGINIEVELIDGYAKVNNLSSQIVFLLREIGIEQDETLKKQWESIVESNKKWGIWYE